MHVPTLYLDTSVIGGFFDDEWCGPTRDFWQLMEMGCYRFVTSRVTVNELTRAPGRVRELFDKTFPEESILPVSEEADDLAEAYLRHGILPPQCVDDANHVAICTVAGIECLVSWNFKHLVNPERKKGFHAINHLQGYRPVSIVTPQEFVYDREDQKI